MLKEQNLAKYTWLRVGGNAEYLYEPQNKEELQNFLKTNKLPITIIGGGSNLLIRDGGIKGVTIIVKFEGIEFDGDILKVKAGTLNSKIYNFCKNNNIGGYEFLGTIPGTIGGAVRGNAGCYKSEIKDFTIDVETINFDGNIKKYSNADCNFEYRKNNLSNDLIFTEISLNAGIKSTKNEIENKFNEYMQKRKETQPVGEKTAGSTFKNPIEMPAWKVIQELGWQNKEIDGTKMSEKHANFLINTGKARAKSVENLINSIIKDAKEKLKIDLELEIKIVGEKNNG
ncbi:MAG: UDP-N-acetylmuramate dehydrogenase [Rickettsiales bacterium]|jgi:UDP-N-acetylmuramate dehydrogenase|nr:UDP-N-acetylmuramate dehydrogenase [Rickettsiales bacterium]